MKPEYLIRVVLNITGACLAVQHLHLHPLNLLLHQLKSACGEGEEIGTDRLCFAEAKGDPAFSCVR